MLREVFPILFLLRKNNRAISFLVDDRFTIITNGHKYYFVLVWERVGYLSEAEKKLTEKKIYKRFHLKISCLKIVSCVKF